LFPGFLFDFTLYGRRFAPRRGFIVNSFLIWLFLGIHGFTLLCGYDKRNPFEYTFTPGSGYRAINAHPKSNRPGLDCYFVKIMLK
jgi:hypothetical protein